MSQFAIMDAFVELPDSRHRANRLTTTVMANNPSYYTQNESTSGKYTEYFLSP